MSNPVFEDRAETPLRPNDPTVTNLQVGSTIPAWPAKVQAISIAVIALLGILVFAFFGVKYLQIQSVMNDFAEENQIQTQECSADPNTNEPTFDC